MYFSCLSVLGCCQKAERLWGTHARGALGASRGDARSVQACWRSSGSWRGECRSPCPPPEQAWAQELRGRHALSSPDCTPTDRVSDTGGLRASASHTEFLGPHFHPAFWNVNSPSLRRQERPQLWPLQDQGALARCPGPAHRGLRQCGLPWVCTCSASGSGRPRPAALEGLLLRQLPGLRLWDGALRPQGPVPVLLGCWA